MGDVLTDLSPYLQVYQLQHAATVLPFLVPPGSPLCPAGGAVLPPIEGCSELFKVYARTQALINSLREKEEGATAVEYALIVGMVSLLIIGALAVVGPAVVTFVNTEVLPSLA